MSLYWPGNGIRDCVRKPTDHACQQLQHPSRQCGGAHDFSEDDPWGRRVAAQVIKIFNGAKPADIPIEQATKFKLIINAKTAKALDLTLPPSLLAAANEVIE